MLAILKQINAQMTWGRPFHFYVLNNFFFLLRYFLLKLKLKMYFTAFQLSRRCRSRLHSSFAAAETSAEREVWKVQIAGRCATLVSFLMELRVLWGLEFIFFNLRAKTPLRQASTLKWAHVRSPLLREAAFHVMLRSHVPAPSAMSH